MARSSMAVVVAVVLLAAASSVRAAEPWEAPLQDHLAGYGLACEADGLFVDCTETQPGDLVRYEAQYHLPGYYRDDEARFDVTLETVSDGLGPPSGDSLAFLVGGISLICPADGAAIEAFILANGSDTSDYASDPPISDEDSFVGATCEIRMVNLAIGDDLLSHYLEAGPLSIPAPSLPPLPTPALTSQPSLSPSLVAPSPASTPTIPLSSPTAAPTQPAGAPTDASPPTVGRGDFDRVIPRPGEVASDPLVIAQSAVLALLLVFLMPFPAQLFNSTLETHETEVRRWFRLGSGGAVASIGRFWASWLGVSIFIAIGALLYSFLDPGFGTNAQSLSTFVGMLLGIVLVTAIASLPALMQGRQERVAARLKVAPLSLAIGVLCVVASRLADFQPGYLYGVLIGLTFARELSTAEKGRGRRSRQARC